MIERECKFEVGDDFELPDLGGTTLPVQELEATYYDTDDLRLSRAGASLRFRNGRWTVKLPEDGGRGPGLVRREFDVDAPGDVIPTELLGLVRSRIRSAPLAPVCVLSTRRSRVQVGDVEVADDEVSVLAGGEVVARFREIEAELLGDGPPSSLAAVAKLLEAAGADPADPTPKVVRALGPRAQAPPDVVVPVLAGDASVGDVVAASIATAVDAIVRHDPGVRLDADLEHVHQARVAARRLRSDLRTFRSVVKPKANTGLRAELQWLGQELGHVRDADVLLERLRAQVADRLPAADAKAGAALLRRLEGERAELRAGLSRALDSDRYLALLDALVAAAADPPLHDDVASARGADALPAMVAGPWKHLHDAVTALSKHPEDEALHEVRILAKRARYAAEAAAGVVGKPAARFAKAVAGVQGVLGDLQDAVVAEAWLRKAGARGPAAQTMVAGQLVVVQREAAAATRRAWPAAWAEVDHKKLRAWLP